MRPLGAGEREPAGADLREQAPMDLALGVAQVAGQARDALSLNDTVGDEAHRPADQVAPDVPLGRAGRGAGYAPLARPEPFGLRGGRGRVEADVLPPRGDRGAARAAVDTRGRDRHVERPVEPLVPAGDRPVAMLEVHARKDGSLWPATLAGIGRDDQRSARRGARRQGRRAPSVRRRAMSPATISLEPGRV